MCVCTCPGSPQAAAWSGVSRSDQIRSGQIRSSFILHAYSTHIRTSVPMVPPSPPPHTHTPQTLVCPAARATAHICAHVGSHARTHHFPHTCRPFLSHLLILAQEGLQVTLVPHLHVCICVHCVVCMNMYTGMHVCASPPTPATAAATAITA